MRSVKQFLVFNFDEKIRHGEPMVSQIKVIPRRYGMQVFSIVLAEIHDFIGMGNASGGSKHGLDILRWGSPVILDGNAEPHATGVRWTLPVDLSPSLQTDVIKVKVCPEFLLGVYLGGFSKLGGCIGTLVGSIQRPDRVTLAFPCLIPSRVVEGESDQQPDNASEGKPKADARPFSRIASRISGSPLGTKIGASIALLFPA